MTSSARLALAPATLAWCLLAIAALGWICGPLSVPGFISISSPGRPLALAVVLAGVALALRRSVRGLLLDLHTTGAAATATLALAVLCTCATVAARGVTAVGGADSAGYLLQATRLLDGSLRSPLPLPGLPVSNAAWAQSTLGFRPDPSHRATVPIYPPGLPLLQAAALRFGGPTAAVRGVPMAAALVSLVALFVLARRRLSPAGAALAVILLATLPTYLFQAVQPMSDVVAVAAWLVAMALAAHTSSRAAIAATAAIVCVATLVRPNLLPLVVPVVLLSQRPARPSQGGATRPARIAAALGPLFGALAAVLIVSGLQWTLHGSPKQSGYGTAAELFALANVSINAVQFSAWAAQTLSVPTLTLLLAGLAALLWHAMSDGYWRALGSGVALTVALSLAYIPFDNWTYLRFLLPAFALLAVAGGLVAQYGLERLPAAWQVPALFALALLVAAPSLHDARELGVFDLREREARYALAGEFLRQHAPPSAIVIAKQHSSSAVYYSGRPTVRLDALDANALGRIETWAKASRRPLVFVLDAEEAELVPQQMRDEGAGALDWPPRAQIGVPVSTRVWFEEDRHTYRRYLPVPTERLLPSR